MLGNLLQHPILAVVLTLTAALAFTFLIPAQRTDVFRRFVLASSFVSLALGLFACLSFDKSCLGFQFLYRLDLLPQYNLALTLGVDGMSRVFLRLTLFTFPICFLAAWSVEKETKQFFGHLLARELLLVLTFSTLDLFYFYLFFESLLIPRFILIGVWGARERKIKAAYYFFLYTLSGSLVRLFAVLYLFFITGSTNYFVILNTSLSADQQCLIWVCFFLAFAVKRPLFPFHIWLPEAHVEAPTVGSRLLASLRLKLGGYGFLRFSLSRLNEGSAYYAPTVSTLALLGVVYGSLSTIRQIDLKRIIAYSSVAHRNLVRLGLFSYTQVGVEGAIYLRVGHGVVSTALFFCVGVLYDRYHSRLLRYYGGLVTVRPLFSVSLFRFTLANRSFPGTSNFLGEILLFVGIFINNSFVLVFATAGIVLSAVYSTWRYNRVAFGTLKTQYIGRFSDLTRRESAIFAVLVFSRVLLGLISSFALDFLSVFVAGSEVIFDWSQLWRRGVIVVVLKVGRKAIEVATYIQYHPDEAVLRAAGAVVYVVVIGVGMIYKEKREREALEAKVQEAYEIEKDQMWTVGTRTKELAEEAERISEWKRAFVELMREFHKQQQIQAQNEKLAFEEAARLATEHYNSWAGVLESLLSICQDQWLGSLLIRLFLIHRYRNLTIRRTLKFWRGYKKTGQLMAHLKRQKVIFFSWFNLIG